MLDGAMRRVIDPPLNAAGQAIARAGIGANSITLFGLLIGLVAAVMIGVGLYWLGLVFVILSRLADGLDGAVARATQKTDFGGYLDIVADFAFYGLIPLGFLMANPAANALPAGFLIVSFYINGASFLGYAVLAERNRLETSRSGLKSLFYADGLMEGTETIAFFALFCLLPNAFPLLAALFALLTLYTAGARVWRAWRLFGGEGPGQT